MGWRDFAGPLMIVDDRGERREVTYARRRWFGSDGDAAERAATGRALDVLLVMGQGAVPRVAVLVYTLLFILCFFVLGRSNIATKYHTIVVIGLMAAWLSLNWIMTVEARRRTLFQHGESLISGVVGRGLCAACAYQLGGVPEQPDGKIVCPECEAAWRATRLRRGAAPRAAVIGPERRGLFAWMRRSRWDPEPRFIGDEYGRRFTVGGPALLECIEATAEGDHRDRLVRARARIREEGLGLRLLRGIAFCALTGFFVWEMQRGGSVFWILVGALGLVFGILMLACLLSSDYGASAAFIRETLLKDDLCPSCMEDLRGIEPGESGLTECPMCTAAWRVLGKREPASVHRES